MMPCGWWGRRLSVDPKPGHAVGHDERAGHPQQVELGAFEPLRH